MKISTTLSKSLYYIVGISLIVLFWFIISSVEKDSIFPTFNQIFVSTIEIISNSSILVASLMSFIRVMIVLIISLIICLGISFVYLLKKELFNLFKPLLVLLKATPLAIISVYLWISLGGEIAPYLITFLMIFPVMIEGFISALDEIDQAYIWQLKTESISFIKKFFIIYIPLIMPYIIMTILQSFGMGIKVMLMGEYICQTSFSFGGVIYNYKQGLSFSHLLSLLLIIVIVVSLVEILINRISKKLDLKK